MSYDFNASNNTIDGTFAVDLAQPLSIVMWIKVNAAGWLETSQRFLVYLSQDIASVNNSVRLTRTNAATYRITASSRDTSDNNAHLNFAATAYDDVWVAIVGTFNSDSLRRAYIENSSNTVGATGTKTPGSLLKALRIGASSGGFSNFQGFAGELAIFNKILTLSEIDLIQTGPETGVALNTIAPAECIGYWPLAVNQANHPDQSGNNGPTLTVNGAPYSSDHPAIGVAGDIAAVNDAPMPEQAVQIGVPYGPFDVNPYWSGVPLPVFFADGLPTGLAINDAGVISGTPQGGFNPALSPTNSLDAATFLTNFVGYSSAQSAGVLNPVVFGNRIIELLQSETAINETKLAFQGVNIPDVDDVFTRIRIAGTFDDGTKSILLNRVDAVYDGSIAPTNWLWTGTPAFVNGESYQIFFENIPSVIPVVTPSSADSLAVCAGTACYSGVSFNNNGIEYNRNSNDPNDWLAAIRGTWLSVGLADEVWIEVIQNSGDPLSVQPPAGRNQLNVALNYGLEELVSGQTTAGNFTFNFYDAVSGGDLLGSVTYNISANVL